MHWLRAFIWDPVPVKQSSAPGGGRADCWTDVGRAVSHGFGTTQNDAPESLFYVLMSRTDTSPDSDSDVWRVRS